MKRYALVTSLLCGALCAQTSRPSPVLAGSPPGGLGAACVAGSPFYANRTTGVLASCVSGIWTAFAAGGGAGTPGGTPGQVQYQVNGTTFGGFTPGGDVTFSQPNYTVVSIGGKTVTLSGNLTTTGAFNPTFAIPSSSTWTFPSGGGALSLVTVTGTAVLKGSGGNAVAATAADVVALFSTCSGVQYLGADGACHNASGASPLTTKGDVWGFSTVDARIPIGANGQVLTADSTQALGLKWATVTGTGTVTSIATTSPITGGTITTTGTIACATCVTSAAALTSTAIMTGAALQASQTPSSAATVDSSGNIVGTSFATTAGSAAGYLQLGQGTAPSLGTTAIQIVAPAPTITSYRLILPATAGSGIWTFSNSANVVTVANLAGTTTTVLHGNASGTPTYGAVSLTADVSGVLPTANIAVSLANQTSINGLGITTSTGTLTIANGKTLTASNSLTLAGTDSTTMTFPGTSQTIPGLGQANAWTTGAQDFGGATSLKIPVSAGATAATNGFLKYDSTNNMLHGAQSSADAFIPQFTINPTNGDCVQWSVSGSTYKLGSAGAACGSGAGGGGAIVYSAGSITFTGTQFIPVGGGGLPSATETDVDTPAPVGVTITKLFASLNAAPVGSLAVTLSVNGTPSALTCTITSGGPECSDTTHSVTVSQDDKLTYKLVTTGVVGGTTLTTSALFGSLTSGSVASGTATLLGYYATTSSTISPATFADGTNKLQSPTTTQALSYIGGADASANSALGGVTVRGANETGAGGSSSRGGNALHAGGSNAATNTASVGGSVELLAGASTGATSTGLQGLLIVAESYAQSSTVTQWNLECFTSTAKAVTDCGASPSNIAGVALSLSSTIQVSVAATPSEVPVNASAAVTIGHTVCAGTTAGKVTDSGGTTPCATGITVGVVIATTGTWPAFPDGTTFPTLSTTLPLIRLANRHGVGNGDATNITTLASLTSVNGSTIPAAAGSNTLTQTIASGTSALGTSAISANACATVVTTSATGTASTDAISWSPNADISGVTGYGKASTDGLAVYPYPTTNNVNWVVCNLTGTSITPGAVTLNWRVTR